MGAHCRSHEDIFHDYNRNVLLGLTLLHLVIERFDKVAPIILELNAIK